MTFASSQDPREALVRTKFFTLRPRPLEEWLWRQRIAPSAERVFWLHWQEGMRSGDWCSSIPLRRVAALCSLDTSSVTRAYQTLIKLGLILRQDPGRDPQRPFEQAIVLTEVRVPPALLREWQQHPDRRTVSSCPPVGTATHANQLTPAAAPLTDQPIPLPAQAGGISKRDPFEGMSGRERHRALSALLSQLSASERRLYDDAMRRRQPRMTFDTGSGLQEEGRDTLLRILAIAAAGPGACHPPDPATSASVLSGCTTNAGPRRLSLLELARLRREIQRVANHDRGTVLLREIVWAVEQGALRRFTPLHAVRIALKKFREGLWTRPNRMPPNWARALSDSQPVASSPLEVCKNA